jgi:antitoxin component of RelBE/YafQ-DinJ toxin-antitoxin module
VGLPKTIHSNQGSNCISHLFQQVIHELNIKEFKANAYHTESQVTLERFHLTLKNIMKTFCFDIASYYSFPYLVLGSGPTQSTITLLKESSKAGKSRSVAA